MGTTVTMSLAQFAAMPDQPGKQELLRGELITVPPPKKPHARVQLRAIRILDAWAQEVGGGEVCMNVGFQLPGDTCLEPDVAFVRDAQSPLGGPVGWFQGAPALVIEILSPSNRAADMEDKVRVYLRGGAEAVLEINPKAKSVRAFYANGRFETFEMPDGKFVNEALFPGLCIPLAALFAGLE